MIHATTLLAACFHKPALVQPLPLRTVQWLDPAEPADAERIFQAGFVDAATGQAGAAAGQAVAAYVCRGQTCSLFEA